MRAIEMGENKCHCFGMKGGDAKGKQKHRSDPFKTSGDIVQRFQRFRKKKKKSPTDSKFSAVFLFLFFFQASVKENKEKDCDQKNLGFWRHHLRLDEGHVSDFGGLYLE